MPHFQAMVLPICSNPPNFLNQEVGTGFQPDRLGTSCLTLEKFEMKKSLIALAVLAASGAAMAQSSVTLYGIADAAFVRDDNGTAAVNKIDSGKLAGSRWGMKGTEDLGSGLKAIFALESGFNLDTGGLADTTATPALMFNRQSFVGLTGDFGAVKLGRQKTPVYATSGTWDSFGNSQAGDSARLFSYNNSRTNNMINYSFATNGFYGEAQYGLGENTNSKVGVSAQGFAGYKAGPFDVVLTHQVIHNDPYTTSTKMTLVGGNYNLDVVKLFAAYATEKSVGATPITQKDLHLGLTAPVGTVGTVELSYLSKKDDLKANANAHQIAIGYLYTLSKRTTLHTSYGQLSNDSAAKYSVATAGKTDKLFMAGISHSF
jgi:predicted porin